MSVRLRLTSVMWMQHVLTWMAGTSAHVNRVTPETEDHVQILMNAKAVFTLVIQLLIVKILQEARGAFSLFRILIRLVPGIQ